MTGLCGLETFMRDLLLKEDFAVTQNWLHFFQTSSLGFTVPLPSSRCFSLAPRSSVCQIHSSTKALPDVDVSCWISLERGLGLH